jgi:hypothetical protein
MKCLSILLLLGAGLAQQVAPPEGCTNLSEDKIYKYNWQTKRTECMSVPAGGDNPDWTDIQNKPATYPASTHQHVEADISDLSIAWGDVQSKPATFSPSAHSHAIADSTGLQAALDGKSTSTHTHNASFGCNSTEKVRGFDANGVPICAADQTGAGGLPSGVVVMTLTSCPATFTEVSALSGKFVLGTVAGNGDVTTTGGSDTITDVINHTHSVSVNDPGHSHLTQRYPTATGGSSGFTIDTSMSGTLADNTLPVKSSTTGITAGTANPAGGVASIDNRPSFVKVIFCSKD